MGIGAEEPLGFTVGVVDESSQPLGRIEKAMISLEKTIDNLGKIFSATMKDNSAQMAEVEDQSKKVVKVQSTLVEKFKEVARAAKTKMTDAFKSFAGFVTASVTAAFGKLVNFLTQCIEEAEKFTKELTRLNEVYSMTAQDSREVAGTLLGLELRAGKTREEVGDLARAMLNLGLFPEVARKVGSSFKELTKFALDFSAATGVSTESSVQLTELLVQQNKIPVHGIRSIGTAIKYVSDTTRISSDELTSFTMSMKPLLTILAAKGPKAQKKFATNMISIAGVLSNLGIDTGDISSKFVDMQNEMSESGRTMLWQLAEATDTTEDQLKRLMDANQPEIWDRLGQKLKHMSKVELQQFAEALKPLGYDWVQLTKIQEFAKQNKSFVAEAEKTAKAAEKERKLAADAAKRQSALEAQIQRIKKMWRDFMIKIGVRMSKRIIPLLEKMTPILEDALDVLDELFVSIDQGEGALGFLLSKWSKSYMKWQENFIDNAWPLFLQGLEAWWDKFIDDLAHTLTSELGVGMDEGGKAIWIIIKEVFQDILDLHKWIWDKIYDSITYLPQKLGKMLGIDVRQIFSTAAGVFTTIWKTLWDGFLATATFVTTRIEKGFWGWIDVVKAVASAIWDVMKWIGKTVSEIWTTLIDKGLVAAVTQVAMIIKGLITGALDGILDLIDRIIVYITRDIIPTLLKIAPDWLLDKYMPKSFRKGIEEFGKAAEERVKEREKKVPAPAGAPTAGTIAVAPVGGGPGMAFPSRMTTADPASHQLQSAMVAELKKLNQRREGAEDPKKQYYRSRT
jgi:hypothetical protein